MRYQHLLDDERPIMPAPQRWLDPQHKEHKPGLSDFAKGGKYLHMPAKDDVTGQTVARAFIDVSSGRPSFKVSNDQRQPTSRRDGRLIKTNLFKQSAGWKWADADPTLQPIQTLVSVNSASQHAYALRVNFESGVTLARYPDAKTEPRLRPTTYGNITLGNPIGTVLVRGRPHTVYDTITIR